MVVTANRFEQSVKNTLADVEVVTRQAMEQMQAKSLPDVLRRLTGIQITQNGGRGQLASLFVRGTNSDQVLVLVDGVRFSRAAKGAVDFNQIPLTYVERIEYVRGPRASLYGSEAIGGVINIITIARSSEDGTKAQGGLGSLDYRELSVASGLKAGEKGQVNLAVGMESDKGYNVHPVSGVNDGDRHGFKSNNTLLGYVYDFNQQWSAFGNLRAYENVYQYDRSFGSRGYFESEKEDISATLGAKYQSQTLMSELQLNVQRQKAWDYEQSKGKQGGTQDKLEQQNLQWINSYLLNDAFTLSGGIDWRKESYTDKVANKTFDRTNSAAFASAIAQFEELSLEASSRLDDNEEFGTKFTYNLAGGYQYLPEFGVKVSYGTAFKAPNLYQQYDPKYGTKDLKPEDSKNWEVSFSGVVKDVFWSITGYDYKINNLIDYRLVTNNYQNIDGKTHIQGIEFVSEFDTGFVQHQISADFKDPEDAEGNQLQRRTKEMYKWNALISFEQIDWSVSYLYVGKRPDVDYGTSPASDINLPAYSLFDTALNYYANESVTVSARVANLFDEEYETALGYPSAERAYYLTIGYQF
ncbi:TonB-dependent vitamin B12 receptor [Photobacterium sp. R1]